MFTKEYDITFTMEHDEFSWGKTKKEMGINLNSMVKQDKKKLKLEKE